MMNQKLTIDFADPAQNLRAFVKLVGNLDPTQESVGWFSGRVLAVLGDEKALLPLFDLEGFGVLRVRPMENGSYRMFNREVAFYKDLRTGAVLDSWTSPFHKQVCEVSHIHNRIVNVELSPMMKMDIDGNRFEIPFRPPWEVMGDTAFSTFEVHTALPNSMSPDAWPRESAGPVLRLSEVFQRVTSLQELASPGRSFASYVGSWTRVGPFLPWMLQGQAAGHLMYRASMKRLGSVDELPSWLREVTARRYPEFFHAPGEETWGQTNDSSFSVYMQERSPAPPLVAG